MDWAATITTIIGMFICMTGYVTLLGLKLSDVKAFLKEEGRDVAGMMSIMVAINILISWLAGDWHDGLWYVFWQDYETSIWRLIVS